MTRFLFLRGAGERIGTVAERIETIEHGGRIEGPFTPVHGEAAGGEVEASLLHTWDRLDGGFDLTDTAGAVDAFDCKADPWRPIAISGDEAGKIDCFGHLDPDQRSWTRLLERNRRARSLAMSITRSHWPGCPSVIPR